MYFNRKNAEQKNWRMIKKGKHFLFGCSLVFAVGASLATQVVHANTAETAVESNSATGGVNPTQNGDGKTYEAPAAVAEIKPEAATTPAVPTTEAAVTTPAVAEQATPKVANKEALKELVEQIKALDKAGKTEESLSRLNKALEQAQKVLDKAEASQEEVDTEYTALEKALAQLVEKEAKEAKVEVTSEVTTEEAAPAAPARSRGKRDLSSRSADRAASRSVDGSLTEGEFSGEGVKQFTSVHYSIDGDKTTWTIGVVPNHKIHRSVGLVAASDDVIESITVSNRGVKGGKLQEEYYVNKNSFDKVSLRNQKALVSSS